MLLKESAKKKVGMQNVSDRKIKRDEARKRWGVERRRRRDVRGKGRSEKREDSGEEERQKEER